MNGKDISPTIDQMETRLSRFIYVEAEKCFEFDSLLSMESINIHKDDYESFGFFNNPIKTTINPENVMIEAYYPMILKQNNEEKQMGSFSIDVEIPFGRNFEIAKKILNKMEKNEEKGYNLENDCNEYYNKNKIYYVNNKLIIRDYQTFANPNFGTTLTFQYEYDGVYVYGIC